MGHPLFGGPPPESAVKHASIVPAVVAVAFGVSLACGPKLDPVQVDTDTTTDGGSADTTGTTDPAPGGGTATNVCGTSSATIGYAANAQAVIRKSCAASNCHGGSQRPVMTDYASSKTGMSGGGIARVQAGTMPLGAALTVNDKCILTTWASDAYAP